jgi:hypothetical protein
MALERGGGAEREGEGESESTQMDIEMEELTSLHRSLKRFDF